MQAIQIPLLLIFPVLAVIGGLKDLISYRIPNWISLALIAAFVPAALVSGAPLAQIGLCLAVGVGALVLGMGMVAAGWIGGGDGKLLAVCALWMGWPGALTFVVDTALAGGLMSLAILTLRSGYLVPAVAGGPAWLRKLAAKDGGVPYGVAIAAGALWAFPHGALAAAALT